MPTPGEHKTVQAVQARILAYAEAIALGVSWNTVWRNIFNWKLTGSGFSNPLYVGSRGLHRGQTLVQTLFSFKTRKK